MSQKIRLYRGPFNGKVLEHYDAGREEIRIRLPKPMSRKERWEFEADWHMNYRFNSYGMQIPTAALPHIQATYRLVRLRNRFVTPDLGIQSSVCMHPDGSLFYEWVKDK